MCGKQHNSNDLKRDGQGWAPETNRGRHACRLEGKEDPQPQNGPQDRTTTRQRHGRRD
jgi:hypothetical protein